MGPKSPYNNDILLAPHPPREIHQGGRTTPRNSPPHYGVEIPGRAREGVCIEFFLSNAVPHSYELNKSDAYIKTARPPNAARRTHRAFGALTPRGPFWVNYRPPDRYPFGPPEQIRHWG